MECTAHGGAGADHRPHQALGYRIGQFYQTDLGAQRDHNHRRERERNQDPVRQQVATRVRDLIRDICAQHEVKIMKGHVAKDQVHLFVSIPPQVTISRLLQWLKGKTAHPMLAAFPHLKKQFGVDICGHVGTSAAVQVM